MVNKSMIILLVSFVALSGCTLPFGGGGGGTSVVNGLIVTKFAPDFPEIGAGEPVTFTMNIQNVGGSIAKGIKIQTFGGVTEGTGWKSIEDPVVPQNDLRPRDVANELPGETIDITWQATAPEDIKTLNSYTASARVLFKYTTSASGTLKFYTDDYLKSVPRAQYDSFIRNAGVSSYTSTDGPISIAFSTGTRPLIIYGGSSSNYVLQITLTNTGTGNAVDPGSYTSVTYDNLYKVRIDVDTSGGLSIKCNPSTSGLVTLSGGQSRVLYCTIDPPSGIVNTEEFNIDVEAEYGYFVETSTTVNVLPIPQI